jgi:2-hydroxyacyl-CoA lyase 1
MAEVDGATLVARALKQHGSEYMFGIVGVPVVPIAFAAQREGIKYYGMRHEQSASYAAQAVGYLTGRPGACLVVSGPGMTNAISGMANAWSNNWPMICIGGASDLLQDGMGAFQDAPQVEAARPFTKYAAEVNRVDKIPYFVNQRYGSRSTAGRAPCISTSPATSSPARAKRKPLRNDHASPIRHAHSPTPRPSKRP